MTEAPQIEALIREHNDKRKERLKLSEQAAKLEVREKEIIDLLTALGVQSGIHGPFEVERKTKKVPRCTDWNLFHAYVRENNALDMLHKRLTETAVMARIDAGEIVPGIVTDDKVTFKFSIA